MENKYSLDFFANMAKSNPNQQSVKITTVSDFTALDAKFILSYSNSQTEILDLASGSGLTLNKIYREVKRIVAVEAFKEFSKFIKRTSNITVINKDISFFNTNEKFDLITMFGIVQYFNESEIFDIYSKYFYNLKRNGKLIIKNQFGLKEDVLVSGFSEELKTDYFSHYRQINKEVEILEKIGYKKIEVIDIYPPECNRWDNTHFFAIVAEA